MAKRSKTAAARPKAEAPPSPILFAPPWRAANPYNPADEARSQTGKAKPPAPEIAAALYVIADAMAAAPVDNAGRRMTEAALMVELVGRGIPARTAGKAIDWAWRRDCLREVSRPGESTGVFQDTITLRRIGNGELADFIGPRPVASPLPGEPQAPKKRAPPHNKGKISDRTRLIRELIDKNMTNGQIGEEIPSANAILIRGARRRYAKLNAAKQRPVKPRKGDNT